MLEIFLKVLLLVFFVGFGVFWFGFFGGTAAYISGNFDKEKENDL